MSAAPPGAKVLTMRTGRDGHSSAPAGATDARRPDSSSNAAQRGLVQRPFISLDPELVALAAFGNVQEQLVERQPALAHALLLRIGHEPLVVLRVALA